MNNIKTLNMNILGLVIFLLGAILQTDARAISAQTEEQQNFLKNMYELGYLCGRELGVEKMRNLPNVLGLTQYPEDNDSLNALFGCAFKKKGIVNEDSDVDEHKLEDYMLDSAVGDPSPYYLQTLKGLVEECKKMKGDDPGQTAVKIQNCLMRYSIERNLKK